MGDVSVLCIKLVKLSFKSKMMSDVIRSRAECCIPLDSHAICTCKFALYTTTCI